MRSYRQAALRHVQRPTAGWFDARFPPWRKIPPATPIPHPLNSSSFDQIWVTLLEKAYAKINGRCYQNLVGGTMTFALKDLTGGDPQMVNLLDPQTADECVNGFLWQKFKLWVKQNNLLGCAWKQGRKDNREEDFDGGIVRGHAYSVLDVKEHHSLKFMKVVADFPHAQRPDPGPKALFDRETAL